MKTVLIPPICDWSFLKQLPQQIAEQFSLNGYKVYYCNVHITDNKIEQINPNLFVYYNYKNLFNDIQNKKIKIDILWNSWAKNYDLVDIVKPKLTIYTSCDNFQEWEKYEPLMIQKSDVVICTSKKLFDIRNKQHSKVYLVRNGCNQSMIDATPIFPIDMKQNEICGSFIGACGSWVSTYLIRKIANKYPVYIVGNSFGKDLPSNTINLGVKDHSELGNYYSSATFGLLPFNTKLDITNYSNPIKLYEYLACGKPVISTSWDETELPEYKSLVFTSKTDEEFYRNVDLVANMSKEELDSISIKAKEVARNNTWEKRFEQINKIIREYCM